MTTLSEASNLPLSGQMQVDAILHAYVPWDFTADSVIHYTFDPSAADAGTDYANVQAYDEATQDATRLALAHAADLTGIAFAETSDPQLAELHFARGDIPASGVFASDLAWEMDGSGNVTGLEADGYVFLHNIYSDVTPGEWSYELLLHEMGHALGLKHPHDSLLRLFPSEDNTDNTVMSYLGTGVFHTEFQEYDVAALDWIYGGDGLGGAGAFRDGELIQVGSAGDDILTGGTGHDYLSDGLGNDTLIGGAGNDLLVGGAGANSLDGGEGDDRYYVTAGDVLTDSAGTDWVFSTVSWILTAGLENLMLYGIGAGTGEVAMGNSLDNVIVGNERGNLIGGGAGNDTLNGGGEVDSFLFAEAPGPANADLIEDFEFGSQDELVFDAAVFTAIGQTSFTNGDARFFAGSGATSGQDSSDRVIYDTATGQVFYDADGSGGGAALLVVTLQNAPALDGAQIEVINGQGDEGMNITGTSGNDTLVGTDSNDTIDGLGGNDAISGQGGDDLMLGGGGSDQFNMTTGEASSYGNDTIDGGAGTDSLFFNYFGATGVVVDFGAGTATGGLGGTGSVVFSSIERVVATASDDHLIGAAGAQNLSGLGGSDTLEGGAGNDTLYGGGGSGIDRFTFREVGAANADSIRDFAAATDMIVLDASVMSALGVSGAFTEGDGRFWAAAGATSGHDADDRVIYNTTTRQLFYDADGNGSGAAQLIATLQSGATLDATNIEVINGAGGGGENITGTAGNDTLAGTAGADTIDGLAGNDSISGLGGDDQLIGGSGIDTLDGGTGADTMQGGLQDDLYIVDNVGDEVVELEGGGSNDHVHSSIDYALPSWVNNLTLAGAANIDGTGNELDNIITGNTGRNIIDPGKGDDTVLGGAGDDGILMDSPASDIFLAEERGNDSIDGGDGNDWIGFSTDGFATTHAMTIDLAAGTYTIDEPTGMVNGTVVNVENVQGSNFDDRIIGSEGANILQGLAGSDVIDGLGGDDLLLMEFGPGALLRGGAGNDTVNGGSGADTLSGGGGNDVLEGDYSDSGPKADRFLFDVSAGAANADSIVLFDLGLDKIVLDGTVHADIGASGNFAAGDARFAANATGTAEDSSDRVVYNTSTGALWYDADGVGGGAAALVATLQGAPVLQATDIEVVNGNGGGDEGVHLVGTSGDDTLVGGPGNDTLEGLAGDDSLVGLDGDDTLDGGDGADTLDGGEGNDTYLPGDGIDVLIDGGGTDTVIFHHGGSLPAGFENAIQRDIEPFVEWNLSGNELDNLMRHEGTGTLWMNGHEGDDTLIGGDGSDRFEYYNLESGNYGSDIVDGGVGNDWLFVGTYSAVVVDFRTGTVTGGDVSGASSIQFASIEAINGNSFGDHMTADDVGRLFIGDHGDDTLVGGAGDDRLWGGGGHDHPDTGIAGNDLLIGGAGDDFLAGGAENDTLDGGTGNDRLRGTGDDPSEDGADRFAFTVAPGATNADLIEDFVSGADTILLDGNAHGSIGASGDFAAGDVRFRAGASAQDADDRVIYNGATGELWYDADGNGSGAMQLIATLEGAPTFAATDITVENGSGGGNPGAEITGTSGDDTLIGTGGDDTIDGLGGNDSLRGEDGADSLRGGAGNDSLNSGLQDDAADTLDGGPGDDLYSVEEGDIILADPGGIDTVVAWNTHWVLGEGLDNLDLGDFSGVSSDGTGNELDNVIRSATEGGTLLGLGGNDTLIARHAENTVTARGGDGDDTLLGMGNDVLLSGDAGNDLLAGGGGFSSMTGGAGADTFFFDSVPGDVAADEQIADFASGVDAIRLDALVMPALGASGDFAASDARFAANSTGTAQDSSDRVVYNTSSGTLWYDADGSGSGAALLIATLQGAPGLAATDIEVINGGGGGNPGEEITGTGGNDTLTGTDGDDTINGLGGNDVILAGATGGTDVVDGGAGRDSIEFKGAATSAVVVDFVAGTITGGSDGSITFTGIERVVTGNFDDQLTGDGAAQNLTGQAGSDTLAGAGGVDTLWGGGGDDEFIFREMGSGNADRISDFASGSDGILLDDAAFTAIGGVGTFGAGDDRFAANASGTAQDGSDRVVYDTSSGQLYYDADGSGSGAAQLIATVQGAPGISATDISVI